MGFGASGGGGDGQGEGAGPQGQQTGGYTTPSLQGGGINYSMLQALGGLGLLSPYAMQGVGGGNALFTPPAAPAGPTPPTVAQLGGALQTTQNPLGYTNNLTPGGWVIGGPPPAPTPQAGPMLNNSLVQSPYFNTYLSQMQQMAPGGSPGYFSNWIMNLLQQPPAGTSGFQPV